MPIERTKRYIRVRIRSPRRYEKFRVIKLGKGIKGVIGVKRYAGKRGGKTELQSILIPKHLDGIRARKYLRKYGGD